MMMLRLMLCECDWETFLLWLTAICLLTLSGCSTLPQASPTLPPLPAALSQPPLAFPSFPASPYSEQQLAQAWLDAARAYRSANAQGLECLSFYAALKAAQPKE
jgi:hypothetical protein